MLRRFFNYSFFITNKAYLYNFQENLSKNNLPATSFLPLNCYCDFHFSQFCVRCLVGWFFFVHFLRLSISTYFMGCVYTKSWSWKKKFSISSIQICPGPDLVFLGYQTIWRPLKVVKWTRNWKSMWKSYTVDISYLMGIFFCFSFFGLCLVKFGNFLSILTKAEIGWSHFKFFTKFVWN